MTCPHCGAKDKRIKDIIKGNQAPISQPPTEGATRQSTCTNCGWESKWRSDGRVFKLISVKKGHPKMKMKGQGA